MKYLELSTSIEKINQIYKLKIVILKQEYRCDQFAIDHSYYSLSSLERGDMKKLFLKSKSRPANYNNSIYLRGRNPKYDNNPIIISFRSLPELMSFRNLLFITVDGYNRFIDKKLKNKEANIAF
jgi:hypothetical protein